MICPQTNFAQNIIFLQIAVLSMNINISLAGNRIKSKLLASKLQIVARQSIMFLATASSRRFFTPTSPFHLYRTRTRAYRPWCSTRSTSLVMLAVISWIVWLKARSWRSSLREKARRAPSSFWSICCGRFFWLSFGGILVASQKILINTDIKVPNVKIVRRLLIQGFSGSIMKVKCCYFSPFGSVFWENRDTSRIRSCTFSLR